MRLSGAQVASAERGWQRHPVRPESPMTATLVRLAAVRRQRVHLAGGHSHWLYCAAWCHPVQIRSSGRASAGSTTSTDRSSARSTTSRTSRTTCSPGTGPTRRLERRASQLAGARQGRQHRRRDDPRRRHVPDLAGSRGRRAGHGQAAGRDERLALPPALPGEEFEFNVEPESTPSSAKAGGPGRGGTTPRR